MNAADASTARQSTGDDAALLQAFSNAVAVDLRELAALHDAEPDAELLNALRHARFPDSLGLRLVSQRGTRAVREFRRVIDALPENIGDLLLQDLAVDYADVYLNYRFRASPYESVWLDEENLERQQPMFEVRESYRRYGLAVSDWARRAEDHLVLQLQFLAHLFDSASSCEDRLREAAQFMDQHLLRWLTDFSDRVSTRCASQYFACVALLTDAYCSELREWLLKLGMPRVEPRCAEQSPGEHDGAVEVAFVPGLGPAV